MRCKTVYNFYGSSSPGGLEKQRARVKLAAVLASDLVVLAPSGAIIVESANMKLSHTLKPEVGIAHPPSFFVCIRNFGS